MPDAAGRIPPVGWSRAGEAAWERVFSPEAAGRRAVAKHSDALARLSVPLELGTQLAVPSEPPDEVETWLADREAAYDDGWEADDQAARDGYNPAR